MKDAYSYPGFCDVAYDWDRRPECDFIERCVEKFSVAKHREILDIACGTGIHLREFARRGYDVMGIDGREEMVGFVLKKAAEEGLEIRCEQAKMEKFDTGRKFGCAICMLDSFRYLLTDEDILLHFKSVADSLEDGGIYFIDTWMPVGDELPEAGKSAWEDVCWTQSRGEIRVDARYIQHGETYDAKEKTFDDELIFKVTGPAVNSTVTSRAKTRALLYAEFRDLAEKGGSFVLKDRFYNFDFDSKGGYNVKSIRTNLVLIKRR